MRKRNAGRKMKEEEIEFEGPSEFFNFGLLVIGLAAVWFLIGFVFLGNLTGEGSIKDIASNSYEKLTGLVVDEEMEAPVEQSEDESVEVSDSEEEV